jgi:hypothetical protein
VRIGQRHGAGLGDHADVEEGDVGDAAVVLAAQGAGSKHDVLTHGKGPVDEENQACKEVAEGLLGGDSQHDAGDGAPYQEAAQVDLERLQHQDQD